MPSDALSPEDIRQIRNHGLSVEEIGRQMELFRDPPPYVRLAAPCTPGKGIRLLEEKEAEDMVRVYEEKAPGRTCIRFVPASGAASRMFKTLLQYLSSGHDITLETVASKASTGGREARDLLEFMEGVHAFPFWAPLKAAMRHKGLRPDELIQKGHFREVLHFLVSQDGLGYAQLPKGLLLFHSYPEGNRTPFEEHLVESAGCARNENGACLIHFTVSEEHQDRFETLLSQVRSAYEKKLGTTFQISFSTQNRATDTIAVDLENRPFRDREGRLVFRPGGHGSLLQNMEALQGDILFVKNIDNIAPDHLKPLATRWKKVLGGLLLRLQGEMFRHVETLQGNMPDEPSLVLAQEFLNKELGLPVPPEIMVSPPSDRRDFLLSRLNRPLRVCGMVRNQGEPGGGPFWVEDPAEGLSPQIVEKDQIDPQSGEQQDILRSSTHFNPVDLVCAVRDWQGKPFPLRDYVDPSTVFMSRKSQDGRELKALEHPGLWNGSMARWNTLFVEVPITTFNPVKTVNDLLRPEHQPPGNHLERSPS